MGLPIWRDPEEHKTAKDAIKTDPTAAARSSIRRRPSIHGRRSTRPRLNRDTTVQPPRLARSPSPRLAHSSGSRRSATRTAVPPISTLLESADWQSALPPPPPVLENYFNDDPATDTMGGELGRSVARLQETTRRLERQTEAMRERLERSSSRVTALQQARIGRSERSRLPPPPSPRSAYMARNDIQTTGRVTLPTPPLDGSDPESDSLFVPEVPPRPSHPLSNSWSADSVDGLGDRNRSPTPADGWEIMRSTITPDATLPSADSSFTSAAASQSFSAGNSTTAAEPGVASSTSQSRRGSSDDDSASDSASSIDPDDLVCDDEHTTTPADMAHFMYDHEMLSPDGRERIRVATEHYEHEGARLTQPGESVQREIGFRLIDEALVTEEGQERFVRARLRGEAARGSIDEMRERAARYGTVSQPRARNATIYDTNPPTPDPERYSARAQQAIRETTAQVHNYFQRYTADALQSSYTRNRSPPPRYTPAQPAPPAMEAEISRDEPAAYPVSPPTQRSQNEVADAILSGDETDLAAMRRVVERLARRDDVPEEWWTSIGLNLSRTRSRDSRVRRTDEATRTRTGRIDRADRRDSRL